MKKFTNYCEKVNFIGVLYHFTTKYHLKTPALKHSNQGFCSDKKQKLKTLKAFKRLQKKQLAYKRLYYALAYCISKAFIRVLEGVFGFY